MHATCTRIHIYIIWHTSGRPARLLSRQCQLKVTLCVQGWPCICIYYIYTHTKLRTKLLRSQASGCQFYSRSKQIYIFVSLQRLSAGKDGQCECFDMFRLKKDMFPKANLNKNCFALFVQASQISSIRSRIIGQYTNVQTISMALQSWLLEGFGWKALRVSLRNMIW